MKKLLQAVLVYGVSLMGMGYATSQLDLPILTQARADWANGCCIVSSECPATGHLCWNIRDAAACGTRIRTDENGHAYIEEIWGYCNATNPNSGKGPGGLGE